jgi:hypothetical protein
MIRPHLPFSNSNHRSGDAILLLNGEEVGVVHAKGWDTSWGFGSFSPNDAFSHYAPIYGTWSLLMHAEGDAGRLSRDAIEELAKAEALVDSIRAQLIFTDDQQRIDVATLTIDGDQLEWKEF